MLRNDIAAEPRNLLTTAGMRLPLWPFGKPLLWASLVAWPVAAWLMSRWVTSFVSRVDPAWWLLPAISLLALMITLATVSARGYRGAGAKPATSLRYE
jgi:putative ABC transport system permease protein